MENKDIIHVKDKMISDLFIAINIPILLFYLYMIWEYFDIDNILNLIILASLIILWIITIGLISFLTAYTTPYDYYFSKSEIKFSYLIGKEIVIIPRSKISLIEIDKSKKNVKIYGQNEEVWPFKYLSSNIPNEFEKYSQKFQIRHTIKKIKYD